MKVSEMIKNLQEFIEKNGDLDCYYAVDDEGNLVDTSIKMTGDSDVFSNANSVQRREYVEPESKGVINGVVQWACPSGTKRSDMVGQPNAKPQCYKEQDMSSGFYSVTDDGKINIYIVNIINNGYICRIDVSFCYKQRKRADRC